jgi:hypothetical protein
MTTPDPRHAMDSPPYVRELLEHVGPWLRYVTETGGLPIAELMAGRTTTGSMVGPISAVAVRAQVYLLARLASNGLLSEPGSEMPAANLKVEDISRDDPPAAWEYPRHERP